MRIDPLHAALVAAAIVVALAALTLLPHPTNCTPITIGRVIEMARC